MYGPIGQDGKGEIVMNKWKNYGLWVSIASLVLLILQQLPLGIVIDTGKYNTIIALGLSILVTLGVISNPTNGNGYLDANPAETNGKWKNYGLWISIASLILLLLQSLPLGINIDVGNYNTLVNLILSVLVAAGVISNPTSGNGFLDTGTL
jgi:uncharacterized membrane protein